MVYSLPIDRQVQQRHGTAHDNRTLLLSIHRNTLAIAIRTREPCLKPVAGGLSGRRSCTQVASLAPMPNLSHPISIARDIEDDAYPEIPSPLYENPLHRYA